MVRPAIPPGQAPSIPSPAAPITGTSVVVGPSSVPGRPGTSTKPVASPNGITIFEGNWEGSDEAEARAIYANDPDKLARNRRLVGELKALYRKSQVVGDVWPAGIPVDRLADVLKVHHIVPLAKGGPDERCNMVVLSPTLHALVHADPTCVIDLQKRTLRIFGCDLQLEVPRPAWLLIGMLSRIKSEHKLRQSESGRGFPCAPPTVADPLAGSLRDGSRRCSYLLRQPKPNLKCGLRWPSRGRRTHTYVIITGLDAGKVGEDLLAQFAPQRSTHSQLPRFCGNVSGPRNRPPAPTAQVACDLLGRCEAGIRVSPRTPRGMANSGGAVIWTTSSTCGPPGPTLLPFSLGHATQPMLCAGVNRITTPSRLERVCSNRIVGAALECVLAAQAI